MAFALYGLQIQLALGLRNVEESMWLLLPLLCRHLRRSRDFSCIEFDALSALGCGLGKVSCQYLAGALEQQTLHPARATAPLFLFNN